MILKVTSRVARWGRLLFLPRFGCSGFHLPARFNLLTIFCICSVFLFTSKNVYTIELSSDSHIATAGYYQLAWAGQDEIFQLQESDNKDFTSYKVIYQGRDLARVISGKPDGEYFYRATGIESHSQFSNIVKITVAHHPLQYAFYFFIAGAIVFIATLVLIFRGTK